MVNISHSDICDLARLTLLIYEYGESFKLNPQLNITEFLENLIENPNSPNSFRNQILKKIGETSPLGIVHKFYDIKSTDLQVGITISEVNKRISIIFRGSESKKDWFYDLSVLKKKLHDNVYVHGGFYKQLCDENMLDILKKDILNLLEEKKDYEVFVTGHSLGGALSTLFGYELSRVTSKKVNIVSFASPRIGNSEFKNSFDKRKNLVHIRITNNRDIVTALPMINFKHVGTNICLYEDTFDIFYNYSYNYWYKFSLFNCWRISDHSMDLYYKRLTKNKW